MIGSPSRELDVSSSNAEHPEPLIYTGPKLHTSFDRTPQSSLRMGTTCVMVKRTVTSLATWTPCYSVRSNHSTWYGAFSYILSSTASSAVTSAQHASTNTSQITIFKPQYSYVGTWETIFWRLPILRRISFTYISLMDLSTDTCDTHTYSQTLHTCISQKYHTPLYLNFTRFPPPRFFTLHSVNHFRMTHYTLVLAKQ